MNLEKIYEKLEEIEYLISEGSVPVEVLEEERDILEKLLKGMVC
jgi:hypothetical protein